MTPWFYNIIYCEIAFYYGHQNISMHTRHLASTLAKFATLNFLCMTSFNIHAQSLEIEIGSFFSKTDTDIRVYDPFNGKEYDLNFESELNLPEDKKLAYFNLEYRFADRHQVYLDWRRLHRQGVQESVSRPFQITLGGNTYHVGADAFLATQLNLDLARFGYGYRFIKTEHLDVHFLTGFHITRLGIGFEGDLELVIDNNRTEYGLHRNIFEQVTAPLPNVGFLVEHHISPKWLLKSHAHAFYLEFKDLKGWMYELEFAAKYSITEHFNFTASFNYYELGVDYQTSITDLNVTYQFYGPMIKMAYKF